MYSSVDGNPSPSTDGLSGVLEVSLERPSTLPLNDLPP